MRLNEQRSASSKQEAAMGVNKLFFACLMRTRPGDLGKILADQTMMPLPDKLRAGVGGLILGQPEGFASPSGAPADPQQVGATGLWLGQTLTDRLCIEERTAWMT